MDRRDAACAERQTGTCCSLMSVTTKSLVFHSAPPSNTLPCASCLSRWECHVCRSALQKTQKASVVIACGASKILEFKFLPPRQPACLLAGWRLTSLLHCHPCTPKSHAAQVHVSKREYSPMVVAFEGCELSLRDIHAKSNPFSVFSSARGSVKPVDIPGFLCCSNANLSAPLKRGRQEEEEGGTQRITALRINTTGCKQWKTQPRNMCTICNYTLFRLTEGGKCKQRVATQ